MNTLDIIVLVVIGLTTVFGIWKGLISQAFSIAGIVGGYFAAVRYYARLAGHLTFMNPAAAKILSFAVIFIGCLFIAMGLAILLGKLFKLPGLGFIDSLGGGIIGFIKGFLIIALIVIFLIAILPNDSPLLRTSVSLPYVLKGIRIVENLIPQDLKDQYHQKIESMKGKILKEGTEHKK